MATLTGYNSNKDVLTMEYVSKPDFVNDMKLFPTSYFSKIKCSYVLWLSILFITVTDNFAVTNLCEVLNKLFYIMCTFTARNS